MVEDRPRYDGIAYGKEEVGESSKAVEANDVSKGTSVSSGLLHQSRDKGDH